VNSVKKWPALALMALTTLTTVTFATAHASADERFTLSSPGLIDNATLDARHAASANDCGGKNVSPELDWRGVPDGTKSFAITIYDPEGGKGLGIVHWIVYRLPASARSLGEGAPPLEGSVGGINRTGKDGYFGPCPPIGDPPHHYVIQAYALDLPGDALPIGLNRDALLAAMKGHVLASSSLVVRYGRQSSRQ
jgi:Raf kinase inhibitor-like YbhB/YbcL family protein